MTANGRPVHVPPYSLMGLIARRPTGTANLGTKRRHALDPQPAERCFDRVQRPLLVRWGRQGRHAFGEWEVRGHARAETRLLVHGPLSSAGFRLSGLYRRLVWGCVGVVGSEGGARAGARAYFGPRPSGWLRGRRHDV